MSRGIRALPESSNSFCTKRISGVNCPTADGTVGRRPSADGRRQTAYGIRPTAYGSVRRPSLLEMCPLYFFWH